MGKSLRIGDWTAGSTAAAVNWAGGMPLRAGVHWDVAEDDTCVRVWGRDVQWDVGEEEE